MARRADFGSNRTRVKEYSTRDRAGAPKVRYFRPSRHMKKSGKIPTGFPLDPNTVLAFQFTEDTLLDQVNGELELEFFRSGPGRFYDETGLLRTANDDVARFDYFPDSHQPRGLLLEGESENMLTEANNFLGTPWIQQNLEAPVQNVVGPDGLADSAWTLTDTSFDGYHALRQVGVYPTVTNRRANVYVQAGTLRYATFTTRIYGSSPSARVNIFDTQEGVFVHQGAGFQKWEVTALPNGWYRIGITAPDANVAYQDFLMGTSSGPEPLDTSYIGTGGTIRFAFPQAEFQIDTSWIETGAIPVTRAQDDCFLGDMSWYSQGGNGTMYQKYSQDQQLDVFGTVASISSGDDTNFVEASVDGVNNDAEMRVQTASTLEMLALVANQSLAGQRNKQCLSWANNDGNGAANGILAGPDDNSLVRPSGMSTLRIGANRNKELQLYGHVQEWAYSVARNNNDFLIEVTQ